MNDKLVAPTQKTVNNEAPQHIKVHEHVQRQATPAPQVDGLESSCFAKRPLTDLATRHQASGLSHAGINETAFPRTAVVQTKLSVNQPNDPYEQEADRVADQVMRMSATLPPTAVTPPSTQLTPPVHPLQAKFDQQQLHRQTTAMPSMSFHPLPIQRQGVATPPVTPDIESRIHRMQESGSPLPDTERTFFEERMGANFEGVKIHTDSNAIQTSRDLNARAFTVGNTIAFNSGEYQPGTSNGRRLLAHELTHTLQQAGQQALLKKEPASPNKELEQIPFAIQRQEANTPDLEEEKDPPTKLQELIRLLHKLFGETSDISMVLLDALVTFGIEALPLSDSLEVQVFSQFWLDVFQNKPAALYFTDVGNTKTVFRYAYGNSNEFIQPVYEKSMETHVSAQSSALPGAEDGFVSKPVKWRETQKANPQFGIDQAYIDVGTEIGTTHSDRNTHGGGSSLKDPYADYQGWLCTDGCTRGQNKNIPIIGKTIKEWQEKNPTIEIYNVRYGKGLRRVANPTGRSKDGKPPVFHKDYCSSQLFDFIITVIQDYQNLLANKPEQEPVKTTTPKTKKKGAKKP